MKDYRIEQYGYYYFPNLIAIEQCNFRNLNKVLFLYYEEDDLPVTPIADTVALFKIKPKNKAV
jgi:hypothetical protein